LAALAGAIALAVTPSAIPRTGQSAASPVDALLTGCPSAADVAAIRSDLTLSFEADPTSGTLVCTTGAGSADLTELQRRVYQILRVVKAVSFSRPLPWTSQSLYAWLVASIDGIRFRDDITFSFCCDPPGYIDVNVTPSSYLVLTPRWIDPAIGGGLYDTAALFVHEARHNDGKPHTCGANDQTLAELGAWGVQYYLGIWTALYSGSQFDAAAPDPTSYRASQIGKAELPLQRICTLPSANLSLTIADAPDPVVSGVGLTYTARVANAGPDAAPEVFVQAETPPGTHFAAATASQGSCAGPARGADGAIGCALGAVAAGASATVMITLGVVSPGGATIAPTGRWTAHVIGSARDTVAADNSASASTAVIAPPPPPCPGSPSGGGVKRVGTAGHDRLTGTGGNDVLCGAGGGDTVQGLGGNDLLRGDAGNDLIQGGKGSDRISGGAGRDRIVARDRVRDFVFCGPDHDVVAADRVDSVGGDCESVTRR